MDVKLLLSPNLHLISTVPVSLSFFPLNPMALIGQRFTRDPIAEYHVYMMGWQPRVAR
jgi:hypothetical protein